MVTNVEDLAAEDAANQAVADSVYAEILHVAACLQPDADELDIHRAGCVWRGLRRAWHEARETESFTQFADRVLATIGKEHV